MSAEKVESIYVRFLGDATSYMAAAKTVSANLDMMSAKAMALGTSMMKYITLPLAAIGTASVVEFAKFDKAMTQSLSIMGAVSDTMKEKMGAAAQEMSLQSSTAADKLAESYYFLASAGMNAEQALGSLGTVNQFAIAGAFDMARATDLLTDAHSALGMNVGSTEERLSSMTKVADALVRANTLANASVEQFSIALTSKAATSMRTFGIEMEDGIAVLATYADQGIKAELAGNALDRVLRLLAKSALENAEEHKKFGLNVFDANGEMNDMVTIVKQLEDGMQGMSTEEKAATLELLGFEARVQQAIFPLLGMSENMARYRDELRNAGGTMDDVANKQMQAFSNQMAITANHVRYVARDIGRLLAPGVITLGKHIQKAALFWKGMDEQTKVTVVTTGKYLALVGPLIAGLALIGPLVNVVAVAFGNLALAARGAGVAIRFAYQGLVRMAVGIFTALMAANPLVLAVAAGIVLIGGAALAAYRYFMGPGSIGEAWDYIKEAVMSAWETTKGFFYNWEENWPKLKDLVIGFITNLGTNWMVIMQNMWTNAQAMFELVTKGFGVMVGWIIEQGVPMAQNFIVSMIPIMIKGFNEAMRIGRVFVGQLAMAFATMAASIQQVFKAMIDGIIKGFEAAVKMAGEVISALKNLDFKAAWTAVKNGAIATAAAIGEGIDAGIEATMKGIDAVTKPIRANIALGYVEGATTDDLMGSLRDVADNAGFVNPLDGTSLGNFDRFNTTMPGAAANNDFVGPLLPAEHDPNFVGPMQVAANNQPAMGALDEVHQAAKKPIMLSMGVQSLDARSADAAAMQINQMLQAREQRINMKDERKNRIAAEMKEKKERNTEIARQRAIEKAERIAAQKKLWEMLDAITDTLTPSDGSGPKPAMLGATV